MFSYIYVETARYDLWKNSHMTDRVCSSSQKSCNSGTHDWVLKSPIPSPPSQTPNTEQHLCTAAPS